MTDGVNIVLQTDLKHSLDCVRQRDYFCAGIHLKCQIFEPLCELSIRPSRYLNNHKNMKYSSKQEILFFVSVDCVRPKWNT